MVILKKTMITFKKDDILYAMLTFIGPQKLFPKQMFIISNWFSL